MKVLFLVLTLICTGSLSAEVHTVCHSNVGICDFSTIQSALDAESVGHDHTIVVEPGTYYENLIIEKSVDLVSRAVYGYEQSELEQSWENWVGEDEDGSWQMDNPYIANTIIDGSQNTNDLTYGEGFRSTILINSPPSNGDQFERAISPRISGFTIQGGRGTSVVSNGDQFERGRAIGTEVRGGGIYSNNAFPRVSFNAVVSNGDQFERGMGRAVNRGGGMFISNGDQFERSGSRVLETWDDFDQSLYRDDIELGNNAYSSNGAGYQSTVGTANFDGFVSMTSSYFDIIAGDSNDPGDTYATEPWVDGSEGDNISFDFTGSEGNLASITTDSVWVELEEYNGSDNSTSGDINNPFATIEWAIKMIDPLSNPNGKIIIKIGTGTFAPSTNQENFPVIMFSNIDLLGSGEENTILDAEGTGKVIVFEYSTNNTVSELTLQGGCSGDACGESYTDSNGNGSYDEGEPYDDLNLNNIFDEQGSDFRYYQGGGVFVHSSNPTFQNMTISGNQAISGGGIYFQSSNSNIYNTSILDNIAYDGGGIRAVGSKLIINNSNISLNSANDSGQNDLGLGQGGGLRISQISDVSIGNTVIDNNTASFGGGLFIDNDSEVNLVRVEVVKNSAPISPIDENEGATAIYVESADLTMNNVTVADNSQIGNGPAEAIYVLFDSKISIINSIIWNPNSTVEIIFPLTDIGVGLPFISYEYSNIRTIGEGWGPIVCSSNTEMGSCYDQSNTFIYSGEGNVAADPLFNDLASMDYTSNSTLCLNSGSENIWYNNYDQTRSDMGSKGGSGLLPSFIEYNFGEIGESNSNQFQNYKEFSLLNFRNTNLVINNILFSNNDVFSSSISSLTVKPNKIGRVPIYCDVEAGQIAEGIMQIESDSNQIINGASVSLTAAGINGFVLNGTLSGNIPAATYPVTGDLIINEGDVATFAPGTKLQFRGEYDFIVNGVLIAEGINMGVGGMIEFENHPDNDENTKWRGFTLNNQTDVTSFKYVKISGAHKTTGGGMALSNSTPTIDNVIISDNSSLVTAGGIHIAGGTGLEITNCIIENNIAGQSTTYGGGGGLWIEETENLIIKNTIIRNNITLAGESGGIMLQSNYKPKLKNVEITNNNGIIGGGLVIESSFKASIINSTIASNSSVVGSGLYVFGASFEPRIINTIIQENNSGNLLDDDAGSSIVLSIETDPLIYYSNIENGCIDLPGNLSESTWVDTVGHGCVDWNPDECIEYGDSENISNGEGAPNEKCCQCGGGSRDYSPSTLGEGNINASPQFINPYPQDSDYSLNDESSSIDAGIEYLEHDGNEELVQLSEDEYNSCRPDIGAYESNSAGPNCGIPSGDVNMDGTLNIVDLVIIVDYILGNAVSENYDVAGQADVNLDQEITVNDLIILIQSLFNFLGREVAILEEINIYKTINGLVLDVDGFVILDIEISHIEGFDFSVSNDVFLSANKTTDDMTRIIIVEPSSKVIFDSKDQYVIKNISAININGDVVQVNIIDLPTEFNLTSAYPNPFNPRTTLEFALPVQTDVSIQVYNIKGQVVSTLTQGLMDFGYHSIVWDASQFSSGVYFIKFLAGDFNSTQKLMLIK